MTKKLKSAEVRLTIEDWYLNLIDECKDIVTEAVANSRWDLVEGYWTLGKRINEENENLERVKTYGKKILQGLAESLHMSERSLYYATELYRQYPEINTIPEGKNISWNKLIKNYLGAPKEEKGEEPKCKNCPIHCHE